jgi:oxygen-independent coproporphyrinogen-3 oxidase
MRHLYVHIPFCRSRCSYCDFAAETLGPHLRAGRVVAYLAAVRAELDDHLGLLNLPLDTIYVGGGTPTALPREELLELVGRLAALQRPRSHRAPGVCDRAACPASSRTSEVRPEFTVEANPGTIDAPLLTALAEAGVTRLSLGVQSFSAALRAALGRRVTQDEIGSALAAIRSTGWQDWNLDLIFGIPGQEWAAAAADLEAAVQASPCHISLYDLTYTPPSLLGWSDDSGRPPCGRPPPSLKSTTRMRWGSWKLPAIGATRFQTSRFPGTSVVTTWLLAG